jgi:hypothetical protein
MRLSPQKDVGVPSPTLFTRAFESGPKNFIPITVMSLVSKGRNL